DARVVEDSGHVSGGHNVKLGRLLPSNLRDEIADRQHLGIGESGEVFQISVADSSGTDHTNAYRTGHIKLDRRAGTRGWLVRPRAGRAQSHPIPRPGAPLEPPR